MLHTDGKGDDANPTLKLEIVMGSSTVVLFGADFWALRLGRYGLVNMVDKF